MPHARINDAPDAILLPAAGVHAQGAARIVQHLKLGRGQELAVRFAPGARGFGVAIE